MYDYKIEESVVKDEELFYALYEHPDLDNPWKIWDLYKISVKYNHIEKTIEVRCENKN